MDISKAAAQKVFLVGSFAYDYEMKFDGLFKDVILADQLANLSVAFMTKDKTVSLGGCAGNIGYNLKMLGMDPLLAGTVGKDFDQYETQLKKNGLNIEAVMKIPETYTAAAYIVTDREQHQITFFHAGAMLGASHLISMRDYRYHGLQYVLISPDDPVRMIRLSQECQELKIPYIFDPGQQIPNINPGLLKAAIQGAAVLIVNEYEAGLLVQQLGMSSNEIGALVPVLIVTYGAKGSSVQSPQGMNFIKAIPVAGEIDPTGCGDAYRAGLLFGLCAGVTFEKACQIGSAAASICLKSQGTQNHVFTLKDVTALLEEHYGAEL